jgi:hypothetical protein
MGVPGLPDRGQLLHLRLDALIDFWLKHVGPGVMARDVQIALGLRNLPKIDLCTVGAQ